MKVAIFSDIHANLTAFEAVKEHCLTKYGKDLLIIHLGDCIDYGMRPNEVIYELYDLYPNMIGNIKGNHEQALLEAEYNKFSSERGVQANVYTKSLLTQKARNFIDTMLDSPSVLKIADKKILLVHGDLQDSYWGKMSDEERCNKQYLEYDYVFSGHTHISSLSYILDRDKEHRTVFINPGSIGQPRNYNIYAQYAVVDLLSSSVYFETVPFDYKKEQILYNGMIHNYYRDRLAKGI